MPFRMNARAKRGKKKKNKLFKKGSSKAISSRLKKVERKVVKLNKRDEDLSAELVWRFIDGAIQESAENEVAYYWSSINNLGNVDDVIAQLRYYNPSAPSTLVTADGTTGVYQKKFHFEGCSGSVTYSANYSLPAHVTIYQCVAKKDTSLTPINLITSGLADITSSGVIGDPLLYPTDFELLTNIYDVKRIFSGRIDAGASKTVGISVPPFTVDPSFFDVHGLSYQTILNSTGFLTRISGVVAHDANLANTKYGLCPGVLDRLYKKTFRVKYDAGADIKFIHTLSSLDPFTTESEVCNKPLAGQQIEAV